MKIEKKYKLVVIQNDISDTIKLRIVSDGHDKPFCTKAIMIVDYFKKALGDIDNR